MAEKLLPCPFCGGAPKLRVHRCAEDAEECYVECPSCEARTSYFEDAYAPTADAAASWNRRAGDWRPPAEPQRSEGYRCIALVELEWAKDISGAFGWHRPDEHAMMMIDAGAPGVHGFLPLPINPALKASGGEQP